MANREHEYEVPFILIKNVLKVYVDLSSDCSTNYQISIHYFDVSMVIF